MADKLKLFSALKKKTHGKTGWKDVVERFSPNLYELFDGIGEKDILKKVNELKPEIILVSSLFAEADVDATAQLVKNMKLVNPSGAIFVRLGQIEDEEEATDLFMSCGAYKCYPEPVIMNALFHDFYVSLHLDE